MPNSDLTPRHSSTAQVSLAIRAAQCGTHTAPRPYVIGRAVQCVCGSPSNAQPDGTCAVMERCRFEMEATCGQ